VTSPATLLVPLEPWKVYGDAVGVMDAGTKNQVDVLNIGILPPPGRYGVSIGVEDGPSVPGQVSVPLPSGSNAGHRRLTVDLTDGGSLTAGCRVAVTFEAFCFEGHGGRAVPPDAR
jgi:hypothetical protein